MKGYGILERLQPPLVTDDVGEFKALLAQNCDVPVEQQRLIYKGRILKDDQTLVSYGLQADHTVHMVRGSAPAAKLPTVSAGNANRTPRVTQGSGPNERGTGTDLGAATTKSEP
ncbi:ubiquitin domain-containing DSK2a-like [Olea europaea subsp. europaea]|uniref:Ubiquitin domain-containing DSK2a-like n=1 Tax=Olea europaea subsp. europaea TaxID=158383 RepID=A0A8S0RGU5_OLEEU|nr:ubiquitin domain-containing DSK2a-like [Olea europaea subsp. europaea]